MRVRCEILGVRFEVTDINETVERLLDYRKNGFSGKYVCFSNVHTAVMSHESRRYRRIQNSAAMVLPDGKPIAYLQRKRGFINAAQVAGPDLMGELFRATSMGQLSHFFYGSTEETLQRLRKRLLKKYPRLDIRGMVSPPFRKLTREEENRELSRIRASGADLIWIGLGAPKQEEFMYRHRGEAGGVMLGVGAGFDFHAGTVKRAPRTVRRLGLEWLYRLCQDPKRLFKRYLRTNTLFLYWLFTGKA